MASRPSIRARALFATLVVSVLLAAPVAATAKGKGPKPTASPPCAGRPAADEWPTFGRDLANTRTQEHAGAISVATTPTLEPAWSYTTGATFAGIADLNGTPIVSDGCVFLNTAAGDVIALDAATGDERWRHHVEVPLAGLGGTFVSSPAVHEGRVLALVNQVDGPYVLALDAADGSVEWISEPMMSGPGYYTNATAVVAGGLLLAGFSPEEGDPTGLGGITLYDARTGALVKRVFSIPAADYAAGYSGGGIWTAPAVDDDGYAYAGTSNPYSKTIEHPNTNAILKIDVNPKRSTFGTVVGSHKGLIEQYDPVVRTVIDPACEAIGKDPNLQLIVGNSAPCLELDLDFGSPPNLFRDGQGRLLIGELQKAGVYHAADTADMTAVWSATVGAPCAACNAAAWAFDGGQIVGASSPVGTMFALDPDAGSTRWASPIADGTHYQSTSIAGGVAFTVDNAGVLHAWEAATGLPLLKRPVQGDAPDGVAAGLSSSGIAIAGGQVIVATGNTVVAYRPAALPTLPLP